MVSRLPLSAYRAILTTDPDVALHSMRVRQPCCRDVRPLVSRDWKLISNAYLMGAVTIVSSYSEGYSVDVHPDQRIRIFMPLTGNMAINHAGRKFDELGKSEAFLLNHGFGMTTFHTGNSLLLLTAAAEPVSQFMRLLDCDADPALIADKLAGIGNIRGLSRIRRTVMNTVWEVEEGFPEIAMQNLFKTQREQALLLQMAAAMAALVRDQEQRINVHARTLRRSIEYIMMTPPDAFSYTGLAAHAGASLRSVQMAFRAEMGTTIRDWVRDYRLNLAREALRQEDGRSITMIALSCGFTHLGRFSAAYRARFGEYPSETVHRSCH